MGKTERDEAATWLVAFLEDCNGEANAGECIKDAERDGISKRTLQRARKQAGVMSQKSSEGWVWILQDAKSSRYLARGTLAPSSKHRASEDIEDDRYLQDAKVPACQTQDDVARCRQVVDL